MSLATDCLRMNLQHIRDWQAGEADEPSWHYLTLQMEQCADEVDAAPYQAGRRTTDVPGGLESLHPQADSPVGATL